jgi:hypothetical protein
MAQAYARGLRRGMAAEGVYLPIRIVNLAFATRR